MGSTGVKSTGLTFLTGQVYTSDTVDSNVFIKGIDSKKGTVRFIDGWSPSAIHNIQEIPAENLQDYIKKWGFKYKGFLSDMHD